MNTKTKLLSIGLSLGLTVAGYSQTSTQQRIESAPTLKVGENKEVINKNELSQPRQKTYQSQNQELQPKAFEQKAAYEYNNNQQFLQSNKLLIKELKELKTSHDKLNVAVLDKTAYINAKNNHDIVLKNYEKALNNLLNGDYKENVKKAAQSELNNLK